MIDTMAGPRVTKLPCTNDLGFYEIRFQSIGGLGANIAAKVLAEALVLGQGLNGANFASYGAEKKGSVVEAYIRLCHPQREVRASSPVERPHLLAIFHEALVGLERTTHGLEPEGLVVVNTRCSPAEMRDRLRLPSGTVAVVDALGIAVEEKARLNTAMLGAIARAASFIDREVLRDTIAATLGTKYPHLVGANLKTFDRGYQEAALEHFPSDGKYAPLPSQRQIPALGYANAPWGGVIINPGNTVFKSLATSREGFIPLLRRAKCTDCGLCDMACPDFCFVWEEGVDSKGRPGMVLRGIDYQYCKGCLKCVEVCPNEALTIERDEPELVQAARVPLVARR